MKLSVICLTVFLVYVNADTYGNKGPRCYDCNYAPSGYVLSQKTSGGNYPSRVGYSSCALRSEDDKKGVDKWSCKSGMCFIRKDYNGLVYRGCADQDKLPWNIDPSRSCQYQGPNKSLWFFCKGDLCNEGQLGESADLCGAGSNIGQLAPQNNAGNTDHHNRQFGKMGVAVKGYGIREGSRPERYDNSYNNHKDNEVYPEYIHTENQITDKRRNQYQSSSLAGVCDGDCYHNPSGLFPYGQDKHHFVQCEADFYGNHPCTCCKATVLPCPYGTEYNDELKICGDKNIDQYVNKYAYDDNQDGDLKYQYKQENEPRRLKHNNRHVMKRDEYTN